MKKLVLVVTAMAFLASGSLAVARRDANRDALQQQWKQQQQEQKKIDAQFKAFDSASKTQTGNPKAEGTGKSEKQPEF